MRGRPARRIDPHRPRAEFQAGITKVQNLLLLAWRDRPLDPGEAGAMGQALDQLLRLHVRENCRQIIRHRSGVLDLTRMRVQGIRWQIGGKQAAVPVGDFTPHRRDDATTPGELRLGGFVQRHQAHAQADGGIDQNKCQNNHDQAPVVARTGGCATARRRLATILGLPERRGREIAHSSLQPTGRGDGIGTRLGISGTRSVMT
jgi:hypothetical protein